MTEKVLQEDILSFAESFPLHEQLGGKTILITGATGLLGSIACKCLAELDRTKRLGITVYASVRDSAKAEQCFSSYPEIRIISGSLDELAGADIPKIDYIIHLASPTTSKFFVSHPVETVDTIAGGTKAVLSLASRHQECRMLYVSSMEVYGSMPKGSKATEDSVGDIDHLSLRSSYPMAKRMAENLCMGYFHEYGVKVSVARLSQTFGAGISSSENRVFAQFAKSAMAGTDIVLKTPGESAHCYCYTTDAVSAFLYILLNGEAGEVYNVGNENTFCSIRQMAEMVCDRFSTSSSVRIEIDENSPYPPQSVLDLDCSKILSLGWKPGYDLSQMYDRLISYMK